MSILCRCPLEKMKISEFCQLSILKSKQKALKIDAEILDKSSKTSRSREKKNVMKNISRIIKNPNIHNLKIFS